MELKRISKGLVNRFSTLEKYERIIRSYYAYYGDDGTDPFFTTPIEKVNTPDKPLTVHLSRKIRYQRLTTENLGKDFGNIQVAVFKDIMIRIQNEVINNKTIIPLPLGLGEFTVKTSFTKGNYSKVEFEKSKGKIIRKQRYAIRTKGKMFCLYWYKAKVRHPAARMYIFEPCIGGVKIDEKNRDILLYGNQGLAVKIEQSSQDTLGKGYVGNYL